MASDFTRFFQKFGLTRVVRAAALLALVGCKQKPIAANVTIVGGSVVQQNSKDLIQQAVASSTVGLVGANGRSVFCSGTILGPSTLLTAAHCIYNRGNDFSVLFGTDLSSSNAVLRPVTFKVPHQNFDPKNLLTTAVASDIAVVHFSGGLPAGYTKANFSASESLKSETVIAAGFGANGGTDANPLGDGVLRYKEMFAANVSGKKLEIRGAVTCGGDSGGPAFVKHGAALYLIGISSAIEYFNTCADAFRVVFTDALQFESWVKSNIN